MAKLVKKGSEIAQKLLAIAKPKFDVFAKYAKVELTPPSPAEFPEIVKGVNRMINSARTGAYKNITVREAWLNTLVTVEVILWFYIGECIGKRHFVGYKV